jgi:hypothetical protein
MPRSRVLRQSCGGSPAAVRCLFGQNRFGDGLERQALQQHHRGRMSVHVERRRDIRPACWP